MGFWNNSLALTIHQPFKRFKRLGSFMGTFCMTTKCVHSDKNWRMTNLHVHLYKHVVCGITGMTKGSIDCNQIYINLNQS